jgi:hypothetical protein
MYVHELVLWRYLRHPNIVPFLGTWRRWKFSLVSAWMPGGTVSTFIQENPSIKRAPLVSLHIIKPARLDHDEILLRHAMSSEV